MSPRSLNRREYGEFKRMLEQALLEIRLPAGIVDTDNIVPGAVRPENCKLDANWDFRGILSSSGSTLSGSSPRTTQTAQQDTTSTTDRGPINSYDDSSAESASVQEQTTEDEYIFLSALLRKVIYTLPPASKNTGKKIHVKRTDSDTTKICRIETFQDDKIDEDDRITLAALEAVIVFAQADKWHILCRYTPS